jgi:hypothetical protein
MFIVFALGPTSSRMKEEGRMKKAEVGDRASEVRFLAANKGLANGAIAVYQVIFPLTPALSLGKRGKFCRDLGTPDCSVAQSNVEKFLECYGDGTLATVRKLPLHAVALAGGTPALPDCRMANLLIAQTCLSVRFRVAFSSTCGGWIFCF